MVAWAAGTFASSAHAWSTDAHRLVAELAEPLLTPAAKPEAGRLLATEPESTVTSIATWPDEMRAPSTAAWHYVNFGRDDDCTYRADAHCPGGQSVVGTIEKQATILGSKAPDEARLKALKYLVHFVADIHQPLHAGFGDDKGGNLAPGLHLQVRPGVAVDHDRVAEELGVPDRRDVGFGNVGPGDAIEERTRVFQIQAYGAGTNLHALWGVGLIKNWDSGLPALHLSA